MFPEFLKHFLSRWEHDASITYGDQVHGFASECFCWLEQSGIVRAIAPATSLECTECGERRPITYLHDDHGVAHGYIQCDGCGIAKCDLSLTRRWSIHSPALIANLLGIDESGISSGECQVLWQLGKRTIDGRNREVWFVRKHLRDIEEQLISHFSRRPRAVIFVPTERTHSKWASVLPNTLVAFESAIDWVNGRFQLDESHLADRVGATEPLHGSTGPRRNKQRAERAAKIEMITKEMVQHLIAAKSHAQAAIDAKRVPELLPRPTQKQIADRLGLTPPDVSRCLNDPNARELKLYWEWASELTEVLRWVGPLKKGKEEE